MHIRTWLRHGTTTDDLDTNAQLTIVQELKTEVENLILSSGNGFKNEKSLQREVTRNLNRICEDFDDVSPYVCSYYFQFRFGC